MNQLFSLPDPPPHVLVVADETIVSEDIARQLHQLGYIHDGTACTGGHAIALSTQLQPDVVLLDLQLSGPMHSIDVARVIRSQLALALVFLITSPEGEDLIAHAGIAEPFCCLQKPFSERELSTVLAMALYKHQAENNLRTSRRQLQALSRRVLEAQEQERRRVAIELHDELGQLLTAIKINLQLSERFKDQAPPNLYEENIRIVEDALQQVHRLATGLRPSMLDDLGLVPALKWMAEQSAHRGGFEVSFHHEPTQTRLAPEIETACFRIAQEALTNITRHAKAKCVEINLRRHGVDLVLSVQDDGIGFDLSAMNERAQRGGNLGVLGMQERAELLDGHLGIVSSPQQGCLVQLRCPWRDAEETL